MPDDAAIGLGDERQHAIGLAQEVSHDRQQILLRKRLGIDRLNRVLVVWIAFADGEPGHGLHQASDDVRRHS